LKNFLFLNLTFDNYFEEKEIKPDLEMNPAGITFASTII